MGINEDHPVETYKSLVAFATEALKVLQILNGGALVAMLAYIGQTGDPSCIASQAKCPFLLFVAGLVVGTLAFGTAYATQFSLFNETIRPSPTSRHMTWLWATAFLAIASLSLFSLGSIASLSALSAPMCKSECPQVAPAAAPAPIPTTSKAQASSPTDIPSPVPPLQEQ